MTHIIGKPPAPKGGATFGDVPDRHVFSMPWRNGMWEMFAKEDGAARPLFGGAERVSAYPDAAFPARILTQPKPRDPEPDPAVTTWRELKPGEWFVWIGNQGATSGLCRKISASTYSEEKRDKACEYIAECDVQSVRPVPASVVVHEEPGARVRVFAAGMATVDLGGNLEVEVDHAELAAIVRQGAALLAQEPASSQSGEPLNVDMGEGFLDPSEDAGWRPAECRETKSQCTQQCATICAKTGEDESAEDRSKPTHAAAVSGCTGTGEDGVELTWLWTDRHGWRLSHYGACLVSNGLRAPEGCTATTAVLEGVTR